MCFHAQPAVHAINLRTWRTTIIFITEKTWRPPNWVPYWDQDWYLPPLYLWSSLQILPKGSFYLLMLSGFVLFVCFFFSKCSCFMLPPITVTNEYWTFYWLKFFDLQRLAKEKRQLVNQDLASSLVNKLSDSNFYGCDSFSYHQTSPCGTELPCCVYLGRFWWDC